MKEASTAEHDDAEHSSFVSELLGGRVNEHGYTDYLLRLRVVYAALEHAVRARRDDPLVAAVYDPALERLTAIDEVKVAFGLNRALFDELADKLPAYRRGSAAGHAAG